MSEEEQYLAAVYPLLTCIARRIQRQPEDVYDFAQHAAIAVLKLYRRTGSPPDPKLTAFAARRAMIDLIRATTKSRTTPATQVPMKEALAAMPPSYAAGVENAAIRRLDLERAIGMADPAEQILLRDTLAGKTNYETAADVGMHYTRVSQVRNAAIRRIRILIGKDPT